MLALLLVQLSVSVSPEAVARGYVNESVTLARAGRLTDALSAVDAAILVDPYYAPAHHNRGVVLAMLGRDRDALAALDRAIRLKPSDRTARRARAAVLRRRSQPATSNAQLPRRLS